MTMRKGVCENSHRSPRSIENRVGERASIDHRARSMATGVDQARFSCHRRRSSLERGDICRVNALE